MWKQQHGTKIKEQVDFFNNYIDHVKMKIIAIKSKNSLGILNSRGRIICFSSGLSDFLNYIFSVGRKKVNFYLI